MLEIALLDWSLLVTPATAIHDLLVGQNGRALRAPVHLALTAVGQSAFVEFQKEPLVPAVVIRQTGRNLGAPVIREAETIHLAFHIGDVVQRPFARRPIVLERSVLSGQTEGVPSHWMKHVVAFHPHVAREGIADGVVAHVPHMQRAGGIRQHFEHVILPAGRSRRLCSIELRLLLPALMPLRLDALCVVPLFTVKRLLGAIQYFSFLLTGHGDI